MNKDEYNKLINDLNNDPLFEEVSNLISKKSFFETYETKVKRSEALKQSHNSPEYKEKAKAINEERKKNLTEEQRKVSSDIAKKYWEINRDERIKNMQANRSSEEHIQKLNATNSTPETKAKRSSGGYSGAVKRTDSVQTPEGLFLTRKDAAKHYGVHTDTMRRWIANNPTEFYYVKK